MQRQMDIIYQTYYAKTYKHIERFRIQKYNAVTSEQHQIGLECKPCLESRINDGQYFCYIHAHKFNYMDNYGYRILPVPFEKYKKVFKEAWFLLHKQSTRIAVFTTFLSNKNTLIKKHYYDNSRCEINLLNIVFDIAGC